MQQNDRRPSCQRKNSVKALKEARMRNEKDGTTIWHGPHFWLDFVHHWQTLKGILKKSGIQKSP